MDAQIVTSTLFFIVFPLIGLFIMALIATTR